MAAMAAFGRDMAFVTASMRAKLHEADPSAADLDQWLADMTRAKEQLDDDLLPLWLHYRQM